MIIMLLLVLVLAPPVVSFAGYMVGDHCATPLSVGSEIMSGPVERSDAYNLVVIDTKSSRQLQSGDAVSLGDTLEVDLAPISDNSKFQFVLEAVNAIFPGGGCTGSRVDNTRKAILEVPRISDGSSKDVILRAAWSERYGAVRVTDNFILGVRNRKRQLAEDLPAAATADADKKEMISAMHQELKDAEKALAEKKAQLAANPDSVDPEFEKSMADTVSKLANSIKKLKGDGVSVGQQVRQRRQDMSRRRKKSDPSTGQPINRRESNHPPLTICFSFTVESIYLPVQ